MHRREFLLSLALLLGRPGSAAAVSLRNGAAVPPHPRLIATAADWQALAERRKADPDLDRFVDLLLERARADLSREPLVRKLEGRRLLSVSRELIRRVLLWAFAFRASGDRVFLERARREMLAVCAFPDWNPDHYLDVAEMTTGLALGYDWLYAELSAEDRTTIRRAIVDKGIAQARHGHKTFGYTNNWGQVCIGGMVLGALAIEEDEPALAADLLEAGRKNVFRALDAYKPDGAYPEGPAYWTYGTSYSVLLVAALRSTLGVDWGVLQAPGLLRSAEFYAHSISPTGKHFNFSDGNEGQELATPVFFMARELEQPALMAAKRTMIRNKQGLGERFAPLAALWWPAVAEGKTPVPGFVGQGPQPLVIWRSAWGDPDALWFAIKAGGGAHNHAHLDAGSFVLDMDGVRWARDLGMQDYNSLESRGVDLWNMKRDSPRWRVFRLGSDGHNVLSIDGRMHDPVGMASLTMRGEREALIDLTPVLAAQVKRATRRARFDDTQIELEDEVSGAQPGARMRWAMNTDAVVSLQGNEAQLARGGKRLFVRFSGAPLQLSVRDISQPQSDLDHPNPDTRQLLAEGPADKDGGWRVTVRFSRS